MTTETTSPAPLRVTVAVAVVVVVGVVALALAGPLHGSGERGADAAGPADRPLPRVGPSTTVTEVVGSLAVLRDWDRARAEAWARGDVDALRRIYLAGSRAGARDVAMLTRWVDRGLRVRRLRMQVRSVDVRVRTDRRIVLDVTDRLADAVAVPVDGGGRHLLLPSDALTTRRLGFRLTSTGWVLAAAYDRPLATTESTSGSENS